jgi:hypothetical protein
MQHWENLWLFATKRFKITLDAAWEDDQDLSWDDTGEVREKIASGEWGCFVFRVRVLLDGREVGIDYLGNSVYADPREFYQEHIGIRAKAREAGCNYGCYFTDMVRAAISEARKTLRDLPTLRSA